jgi:hypothetical protein
VALAEAGGDQIARRREFVDDVCVAALQLELDRAREDPASPALSVAPGVILKLDERHAAADQAGRRSGNLAGWRLFRHG